MSDDIFQRNRALDAKIGESDVGRRLRRLDRNQRWLAISLIFDVLLSVATAVFGTVAYDASQSAKTASSLSRINCLAGNQTRVQSQQLWSYVLSFPPPPNETPVARKTRLDSTAKFRAYIKKVFAPRDCSTTALAHEQARPPVRRGLTGVSPTATPTAQAAGTAVTPQVSVTVVVTPTSRGSSATPQPSSHSPPPASPSQSPSPTPTPTQSCIVKRLICLPLLGASSWQPPLNVLSANTVTVPGGTITPTQIESLVNALQPSAEVRWDTAVLATPTHPSLARLLAPWMSPTRVVISIQSSSWAIQVVIPLTQGT